MLFLSAIEPYWFLIYERPKLDILCKLVTYNAMYTQKKVIPSITLYSTNFYILRCLCVKQTMIIILLTLCNVWHPIYVNRTIIHPTKTVANDVHIFPGTDNSYFTQEVSTQYHSDQVRDTECSI